MSALRRHYTRIIVCTEETAPARGGDVAIVPLNTIWHAEPGVVWISEPDGIVELTCDHVDLPETALRLRQAMGLVQDTTEAPIAERIDPFGLASLLDSPATPERDAQLLAQGQEIGPIAFLRAIPVARLAAYGTGQPPPRPRQEEP